MSSKFFLFQQIVLTQQQIGDDFLKLLFDQQRPILDDFVQAERSINERVFAEFVRQNQVIEKIFIFRFFSARSDGKICYQTVDQSIEVFSRSVESDRETKQEATRL